VAGFSCIHFGKYPTRKPATLAPAGVPAESLTQIFEPFFQVEEAREADTGNIGLGLSIAKRAVHLHRGTIIAQNAFPGLRVQITIPR
jgi:two-component system sensor histidine kinase CpxA